MMMPFISVAFNPFTGVLTLSLFAITLRGAGTFSITVGGVGVAGALLLCYLNHDRLFQKPLPVLPVLPKCICGRLHTIGVIRNIG